ncbi:hypothetical protein EDD55_103187 [Varunaivibrio sulfuroxidans]|uniref:Uncharacterized protein n=1 Tax=Varunaivibrio sulfuroxidans TaxID=1773489 RepID=A0A4R3JD15_9PROT|nr:hypothetical protein EDD55_103187 [Varunaivibrio sulfuroxidans]
MSRIRNFPLRRVDLVLIVVSGLWLMMLPMLWNG